MKTSSVNPKVKQIYLDAPNIGALEKEYLAKAIDSGFVSSIGPLVTQFEETFACFVGAGHAVSTQSGTAALHMALQELGIGPGDEVIVPALTFAATVNPVLYVGARPVIVDVDPKTWNIDLKDVERSVTKKTKAIVPVHLYGNPCDMASLMKTAKEKNISIIEDATESLGAKYNNQYTGTLGEFGCFSFNGNKIITTGGGGMVVGRNNQQLAHIQYLANQAKDKVRSGFHAEMGFNYRMTNIEAALGLAQMERLEGFLNKKRVFAAIYREELGSVSDIQFQETYTQSMSSFWLNGISFKKEIDLALLQRRLKDKGIATNRIFMPLVELPYLMDFKLSVCEKAKDLYQRSLCLPSSTLNSEDDIALAAKILKEELSELK